MNKRDKKILLFDLWETLIFGAKDSAISVFYKEMAGEEVEPDQLKKCMLIKEPDPRRFLEQFLHTVTPSNHSSMLLSINNPRSPLYKKIVKKFNEAIKTDLAEMRWMPGAIELLESLKKKYGLFVVSNLWAYQKKYLYDAMDLKKYFDRCLFSCDTGMNKNDLLADISRLSGANPGDILYVGSSYEYDIIPAVKAGLSAVMMRNDNNCILPGKVEQMIDEEFNIDARALSASASGAKTSLNIKDTLIVIPPFYKLLGSHNNRMNLGASSISASLTSRGYGNKVYHCDSEPHEKYITRYQMVFNSIDFYSALEKEGAYKKFENFYKKQKSGIVFVTCGDILNPSFDSGNWDSTKKIAKIVRKINPRAFIVAVGPELGNVSEDFDLIVHGEAEKLLDDIIKKKARGSVWGDLLPEIELRDLPIFDIKNIVTDISPASLDTIIWRRGCIGTCSFCRVAEINKGKVRLRSIASVIKEMRLRHDAFRIKNFYIVDANFTSNKAAVLDFCKALEEELPDVSWRTESRFDTIDGEVIAAMKRAGCTHIKLGLENALHEKHQVKTKKVSIEMARNRIALIQKHGIKCIVYLMLGGKWFTSSQYMEMYRNAESLNADGYTVSFFNPYPSTPAGISFEEWNKRKFTGSHLDIRLIDFWKIPINVVEAFFALELKKGREDRNVRSFIR